MSRVRGQLNTYLNWYRRHEMVEGDNPPIGLLLCSSKDESLVEYALPGMDPQLFVSRYQLELPRKEDLERFLTAQLSSLGDTSEQLIPVSSTPDTQQSAGSR